MHFGGGNEIPEYCRGSQPDKVVLLNFLKKKKKLKKGGGGDEGPVHSEDLYMEVTVQ